MGLLTQTYSHEEKYNGKLRRDEDKRRMHRYTKSNRRFIKVKKNGLCVRVIFFYFYLSLLNIEV